MENNMNFVGYLNRCSYSQLQELKTEIVSLLILDKEKVVEDESVRFIISKHSILPVIIDVVEDIEEVLERLNGQQGDLDSIVAGAVQLVKVNLIMHNHLESASFYKTWMSNGYIAQIKKRIKLSY